MKERVDRQLSWGQWSVGKSDLDGPIKHRGGHQHGRLLCLTVSLSVLDIPLLGRSILLDNNSSVLLYSRLPVPHPRHDQSFYIEGGILVTLHCWLLTAHSKPPSSVYSSAGISRPPPARANSQPIQVVGSQRKPSCAPRQGRENTLEGRTHDEVT